MDFSDLTDKSKSVMSTVIIRGVQSKKQWAESRSDLRRFPGDNVKYWFTWLDDIIMGHYAKLEIQFMNEA